MSKIDCVALGGHLLRIEFSNGSIRDVDIEPLLSYPVFKRLADDVQFRQFPFSARLQIEINTSPAFFSLR